jgi:hypothetical protein
MAYENIQAPANYYLQSFGQKGFRKVTSAFTPVTGEYYRAIFALEDSIITANAEAGDDLSAQAILAGTVIYGLFSSVAVSSGSCICYIA